MATFTVTYTDNTTENVNTVLADTLAVNRLMRANNLGDAQTNQVEASARVIYQAHKRTTGDTRSFDDWANVVDDFSQADPKATTN